MNGRFSRGTPASPGCESSAGTEPAPGSTTMRAVPASFQQRVAQWMYGIFARATVEGEGERALRLLEEATEAAQACGVNEAQALTIVTHVYSCPPGEIAQELGGVAVTLAALCQATGVDLESTAQAEIERCERGGEAIARHHAWKTEQGLTHRHDEKPT